MPNKKILVVDDEADLREALNAALTHAGFETITATDGEEGLAQALAHKPDLILLDIMMPKMNGHDMLNILRRDPWGRNVPVFLLSNLDDPKNITEGFERKSNDYIIKSSTSLESITKMVKQYLAGYHD